MFLPYLQDELLHLSLGTGVQPCRRLVQEQQDGRCQEGTGDGHFLLHAARHLLQRPVDTLGLDPQPVQDLNRSLLGLLGSEAVETGGIYQILHGR